MSTMPRLSVIREEFWCDLIDYELDNYPYGTIFQTFLVSCNEFSLGKFLQNTYQCEFSFSTLGSFITAEISML